MTNSNLNIDKSNYEFAFDDSIDIREVYDKVVDSNSDDQSLYDELLKYYVVPGVQVLKSISKREGIKAGKNVKFDKMTGVYRSTTYGYVSYNGVKSVSIIPVINVSYKWRGVLVLPPQKDAKRQLTLEEIQMMISEIPIKLMVDYDKIAELVERNFKNNEGVCCVFVEGRKPVDGNVQKVVLDYDLSIGTGKKSEDGSIDFKERSFVHNIDANIQIAHFIPEKPAVDGLDIYNEVMSANFDEDTCYKIGNNLKVDDDGITIRSAIRGILVNSSNNTLSVSDTVEIDKVDLSTGNIEVDGSVIIKENVTPGFSIKTEGNIEVYGNIEDAKIDCGGNLIVSGGIIGGPDSDINIKGKIYSSFIRNAKIMCKDDVISQQIVNSDISTSNRVIALEGKGVIIGGSIKAMNGVWAKSIGAISESKTTIMVGRDPEADALFKEITNTLKTNKEEINKIKSLLGSEYFRDPKSFIARIAPEKRDAIKGILKRITDIIKETKDLEQKRNEMAEEFERLSNSTITAMEGFFPGVTIYISSIRKYITNKISGTEYFYSKEKRDISEKAPKHLDEAEYTRQDS
ncbi:DUF342 domain-containing protein [uncultured Brachyspira sp.]|uniref:DUF342 domain-containing protein n=1 Tax=uncultured Brachyspira sp. TaxID=221953 RepID=UPI002609C390|nr:FapA family protein [uncultured Brachyspira sp.]